MVSRLEAPSAVGYVGCSVTSPPRPPARPAARRRARRAPAAAARRSTGVPENRIGCRVVGSARSPSPTSTTGSSPNRSAAANPSSMVLIGPHGTPASSSRSNHSCGRALGQPLLEQRPQLVAVAGAVAVVEEPLVLGDLGDAQRRAEPLELPVVGGDHDQVGVRGRERLVGEDARVRVAHPVGHHAAGHPGRAVVDQPGERRGEQVDLDVLALAGARRGAAARPGCRSPRGCRPSRRRPRCRRGSRGPSADAGQAHQPGHRLHQQVVAGHVGARSPEPKPLIEA